MWHSLDFLLTGLYNLTGWKSLPWRAEPPPKNFRKETQSYKKILLPETSAHTVVLSRTIFSNLTFMWLAH